MASSLTSINIGILGLGVVGSGFVKLLSENRDELIRQTGYDVTIRKIAVLNLDKPRKCSIEGFTLCDNAYDVIQDPEIDIVIELIGGIDLTAKYLFAAISEGKHIITANKALIAKFGNEIFSSAQKKNVVVVFEAAVAGGLPIIKILREGLSGNKIKSIAGILNGTGNFILTKMQNDAVTFNNALKEAQHLGYAEADPSNDVKGIDTVQKLSILASIAFGMNIKYEEIHTEGIEQVSFLDLFCAKKIGYVIKHLAYAERDENKIHLHVHPSLIPSTHKLAAVDEVMNGIQIVATPIGTTFFYGAGAGGDATATAIVADLIDVIRLKNIPSGNKAAYLYPGLKPSAQYSLELIEHLMFSYYIRITKDFDEKVLRATASKYKINLIKFEKITNLIGLDDCSIILMTDRVFETVMNHFVVELQNILDVNDEIIKFRIFEHENALRPLASVDLNHFAIEVPAFAEC